MKSFVILSIIFFLPASVLAQGLPANAGYRDGFYMKSENGDFSFKIGSRLNFLYSHGTLEAEPNVSSMDLKHGKLYFGGNAFGPHIQYYMQSAFAKNSRSNDLGLQTENNDFILEDYYIRANYGDLALQIGQFKVPFSKQYMIYSGNLQFVTRSIASDAFSFGRDRGVTIFGRNPWLSYALGVFNGGSTMNQPDFTTFQTSQNLSNSPSSGMQYVARISLFPQRPTGYAEGDTAQNEASRFEIGTSFVMDHKRPFDTDLDQTVDEPETNTMSVGSDISWKRNGLSFHGEFYYRRHSFENIANVSSVGYYAQGGYYLIPRRFELGMRYARVKANQDLDGSHSQEISGVASYLFRGDHKYKMQWQYSNIHQELTSKNDHWFHWMIQLTI